MVSNTMNGNECKNNSSTNLQKFQDTIFVKFQKGFLTRRIIITDSISGKQLLVINKSTSIHNPPYFITDSTITTIKIMAQTRFTRKEIFSFVSLQASKKYLVIWIYEKKICYSFKKRIHGYI